RYKCLQDDVTELRILIQNFSQLYFGYFEDFTVRPCDRANDFWTTGKMADVAGEISRSLNPQCFRLVARYIDDLDFARSDDEKLGIAIAGVKQRLPSMKFFRRCAGITCNLCDLRFGQNWKRDCF